VDDREVDEASVANMLIGTDRAGSVVDLVIRKKTTGVRVHVPLHRVQHKIQFSQRLGDHDLKIVVETTGGNPPSRSPDALEPAQAVPGKYEPCVDDLCEPDPELVQQGVWRIRMETPPPPVELESDTALCTARSIDTARSFGSAASPFAIALRGRAAESEERGDGGAAPLGSARYTSNRSVSERTWQIVAELEAAAAPEPAPSIRPGYHDSARDKHRRSTASPPHANAECCRLCGAAICGADETPPPVPAPLARELNGGRPTQVPKLWIQGSTPRRLAVPQAPGRVGVRMRDAEGYQYYSCSECVEMCASTWRSRRSTSPLNPRD